MTRTYSIFTKYLELAITIDSKDVITHSVMSGDGNISKELRDILDNGIEYTRGLVKAFERAHEDVLNKVGK